MVDRGRVEEVGRGVQELSVTYLRRRRGYRLKWKEVVLIQGEQSGHRCRRTPRLH